MFAFIPFTSSVLPQIVEVAVGVVANGGGAVNVTLVVRSAAVSVAARTPSVLGAQRLSSAAALYVSSTSVTSALQGLPTEVVSFICALHVSFAHCGSFTLSRFITVVVADTVVSSAGSSGFFMAPGATTVLVQSDQSSSTQVTITNTSVVAAASVAPQYLLVLNQSASVTNIIVSFDNVTTYGAGGCGVAAVNATGRNVTVAVRGSALGGSASTPYLLGGQLNDGVAYVIENCTLTGFSRAVAPSMALYNGPRVALGCNAWRPSLAEPAVPLSRDVLALPGDWVTYTQRGGDGPYCLRPTASLTATATQEVIAPPPGYAAAQQLTSGFTVAMLPTVALVVPSGAAALQSVQMQYELLACTVDDGPLELGSSPTRLRVGTSPLAYHYGAVLGNVLVLWACPAAALAAAVAAIRAGLCGRRPRSVKRAMALLLLPGWLLHVYLPLLQPTMASTVAIAAAADATALGAICATIGFAACVAPCAAASLMVTRHFGAAAVAAEVEDGNANGDECALLARAKVLVVRLLRERTEYVDAAQGSGFVRMYGALFADFRYGRHWFGAVELAQALLLGVIRGTVLSAAQHGSCAAPTAAAATVAAAMLAAMALCRPHNAVLDACMGYGESALQLVGCVMILTAGSSSGATARFLEFQMYADVAAALVRLVPKLRRWRLHCTTRLPTAFRRCAGWIGDTRIRRRDESLPRSREERLRVLVEMICFDRVMM
jgi:hypothetical protein